MIIPALSLRSSITVPRRLIVHQFDDASDQSRDMEFLGRKDPIDGDREDIFRVFYAKDKILQTPHASEIPAMLKPFYLTQEPQGSDILQLCRFYQNLNQYFDTGAHGKISHLAQAQLHALEGNVPYDRDGLEKLRQGALALICDDPTTIAEFTNITLEMDELANTSKTTPEGVYIVTYADKTLAVDEHDLQAALEKARVFGFPAVLVSKKFDLNDPQSLTELKSLGKLDSLEDGDKTYHYFTYHKFKVPERRFAEDLEGQYVVYDHSGIYGYGTTKYQAVEMARSNGSHKNPKKVEMYRNIEKAEARAEDCISDVFTSSDGNDNAYYVLV